MNDIVLIDKPKGITSFDVIRRLRRIFGVRKMGHAGTLDPNATGLLIIGIGKGTKQLQDYLGLPKTYHMDILLGVKTDTGDIEGKIIETKEMEECIENATHCAPGTNLCTDLRSVQNMEKTVAAALNGMAGMITLPIPAHSALKYKGKPRYAYARKGIAIEPKMRSTELYALKLLGIAWEGERPLLKIEMDCESGTYARSVAEEIGTRLGVPATLTDLRRTRIGPFTIDHAIPLP